MRGVLLCLVVVLAGCTARASRQATLPPPPKPEAVKPAVEPPLSIPQTSASLNVPREWNAAAIPPEQAPEPPAPEKVEAPPAARSPHRTPAPPPAKAPETAEATTTAPPETTTTEEPAVATPPASDTAPFQPIVPVEEQNQLKTAIAARKRDVLNLLNKAAEHGGNDKTQIEKIKSFLNLTEEAEKRGDYTQAGSLSARALLMAQDLKVE